MVKIVALALSLFATLGVLLVLSACVTGGGSFCAVSRPIRPTAAEIQTMSDETVAGILAHNKKMEKLCGINP